MQHLLKPDLPNTKRFYKLNRKQFQNLSPFYLNEVLVKNLGSYYWRQWLLLL